MGELDLETVRRVFEDTLMGSASYTVWHRQISVDYDKVTKNFTITVTNSKLLHHWAEHEKAAAQSQLDLLVVACLRRLEAVGYCTATLVKPYIRGVYKDDTRDISRLAVSAQVHIVNAT